MKKNKARSEARRSPVKTKSQYGDALREANAMLLRLEVAMLKGDEEAIRALQNIGVWASATLQRGIAKNAPDVQGER